MPPSRGRLAVPGGGHIPRPSCGPWERAHGGAGKGMKQRHISGGPHSGRGQGGGRIRGTIRGTFGASMGHIPRPSLRGQGGGMEGSWRGQGGGSIRGTFWCTFLYSHVSLRKGQGGGREGEAFGAQWGTSRGTFWCTFWCTFWAPFLHRRVSLRNGISGNPSHWIYATSQNLVSNQLSILWTQIKPRPHNIYLFKKKTTDDRLLAKFL